MLRKLKYVVAIAAVLCGFGVAGVSPASAANCSWVYESSTAWDPTYGMYFNAYIDGCTGVSMVEFGAASGTAPGTGGKWWDYTWGGYVTTGNRYSWQQTYVPVGGNHQTFYTPPWCVGQTHYVYTYFWYRIKNAAWPYSWGPWHQRSSGSYNIRC